MPLARKKPCPWILIANSQLLDESSPAVGTPQSRRYTLLSGLLKTWSVMRISRFNALLGGLFLDFWTTVTGSPNRRHGNHYSPSQVCVCWMGWGGQFSRYQRGENGDLRGLLLLSFPEYIRQDQMYSYTCFFYIVQIQLKKVFKVLRALFAEKEFNKHCSIIIERRKEENTARNYAKCLHISSFHPRINSRR